MRSGDLARLLLCVLVIKPDSKPRLCHGTPGTVSRVPGPRPGGPHYFHALAPFFPSQDLCVLCNLL